MGDGDHGYTKEEAAQRWEERGTPSPPSTPSCRAATAARNVVPVDCMCWGFHHTKVILKHTPPRTTIASNPPVLDDGFSRASKQPPRGGSLGRCICLSFQGTPERGVPWILDSPGPPLTLG